MSRWTSCSDDAAGFLFPRLGAGAAALSIFLAVALAAAAEPAAAQSEDPEIATLSRQLAALESDPSLGDKADAQRYLARRAIDAAARAGRRERDARIALARVRLDAARLAAEAELVSAQIVQIERERDRLLLEASRNEAELARREAEQMRLQALAEREEMERSRRAAEMARDESEYSTATAEAAMAEADQARRVARARAEETALARREAELAGAAADNLREQLQATTSSRDARGEVLTLSGEAFASGSAKLAPGMDAEIARIADIIRAKSGARVRIEGHTDSDGSANANQLLSQQRAEAVKSALAGAGLKSSRLTAVGIGEEQPRAGNDSASGRAKNRRVEIIVAD